MSIASVAEYPTTGGVWNEYTDNTTDTDMPFVLVALAFTSVTMLVASCDMIRRKQKTKDDGVISRIETYFWRT